MKLGDVTIHFDEEQLKRFEAAAAAIPDGLLDKESASDRPADFPTVTITVPTGPVSRDEPAEAIDLRLSTKQGKVLRGILNGLMMRGETVNAGHRVATNHDALLWLLDQIAEQVEKAR